MFDENGNFIPVGSRPYTSGVTGFSAFAPAVGGDYANKLVSDAYKSIYSSTSNPVSEVDLDKAILMDEANKSGMDFGTNSYTSPDAANSPWYKDSGMLGSIAGLGSVLVQAANLPSQIDLAKTQTKALKQNIATAKEEQARRNKNIASFNAHRTPTSAFAQ
jgi:hypothetical protein